MVSRGACSACSPPPQARRNGRYARPVRRLPLTSICVALALAFTDVAVPAAALAAPAGGSGGTGSAESGNAFSELTKGGQETTPAKTTSTPSVTPASESSSGSKTAIVFALGGAALLLGAIGFFIVRDVRRVAPVSDGPPLEERTARDAALRVRKRRAQAKAARRQRKRNR
jgi:hypothetical protein